MINPLPPSNLDRSLAPEANPREALEQRSSQVKTYMEETFEQGRPGEASMAEAREQLTRLVRDDQEVGEDFQVRPKVYHSGLLTWANNTAFYAAIPACFGLTAPILIGLRADVENPTGVVFHQDEPVADVNFSSKFRGDFPWDKLEFSFQMKDGGERLNVQFKEEGLELTRQADGRRLTVKRGEWADDNQIELRDDRTFETAGATLTQEGKALEVTQAVSGKAGEMTVKATYHFSDGTLENLGSRVQRYANLDDPPPAAPEAPASPPPAAEGKKSGVLFSERSISVGGVRLPTRKPRPPAES